MPPEKVGLLLPAIKKVLFDESRPRKERDYSRKRRSPRPGSPRPDGQGAAILPEELQAELTRLAEATSRVSAWEFHKEAHGIKGDLERKKDEFFVTHDEPQWLSHKEAHVPDPKAAASKSRRGRDSPELNEARREIIVDSGASRHMIGLSELNETEKNTIRKLKQPFLIQTAHGVVACDKEAKIYIHDLDLWVWAGLLEDSPAVLSLGLFCKRMVFRFPGRKEKIMASSRKEARPLNVKRSAMCLPSP